MDAIVFLQSIKKMCSMQADDACDGCSLYNKKKANCPFYAYTPNEINDDLIEGTVKCVEKWSKKNSGN